MTINNLFKMTRTIILYWQIILEKYCSEVQKYSVIELKSFFLFSRLLNSLTIHSLKFLLIEIYTVIIKVLIDISFTEE